MGFIFTNCDKKRMSLGEEHKNLGKLLRPISAKLQSDFILFSVILKAKNPVTQVSGIRIGPLE